MIVERHSVPSGVRSATFGNITLRKILFCLLIFGWQILWVDNTTYVSFFRCAFGTHYRFARKFQRHAYLEAYQLLQQHAFCVLFDVLIQWKLVGGHSWKLIKSSIGPLLNLFFERSVSCLSLCAVRPKGIKALIHSVRLDADTFK